MSSPTTRSFNTPAGVPKEIAEFVSAVRAWLNDLSADEVNELTGGLEADLTDALAEAGSTPSERYGDPAEYASELRAAAGLPPRGGVQKVAGPSLAESIEQGMVRPVRERYERVLRTLDREPWWPGVRDFLVVVRPAWWVIRAWVAVQCFFLVLGAHDRAVRGGFGGLVVLLAAIVLSVQLGRHTPLPVAWQRFVVAAWNVVAVLFLLPMLFTSSGGDAFQASYDGDYTSPGLNLNGEAVTNVFPYDSQGRPLTGVQLYDQDGRPLETDENNRSRYDEATGAEYTMVPGSPDGLAPRWNAFPLQQRSIDQESGAPGPIRPAPRPLSGVPLVATPTEEAGPTQTPSPSGTAEPTAEPSAKPSAKSSGKAVATPTATN